MSAFHSVTAAREEAERKGKEHELLGLEKKIEKEVRLRIEIEESLKIPDRNSWDVV